MKVGPAKLVFILLLVISASAINYSFASHLSGDIAPYGTPDGNLNAADVLILQRFISGDLIPSVFEIDIADVAPLGIPDGKLNAGDLVVLQRAVLGLITLPPFTGNVPPVLAPVGPQTVVPGSTLSIALIGNDENSDPLTYSAAPLPLPANAGLDMQTGLFSFSPDGQQGGSYQLTFSVSDGTLTTSEVVDITVTQPVPGDPTSFTGTVLDANAFENGLTVPVVGATISILGTGLSTVTDSQGNFTLTGLPSGDQILDINAASAQQGPGGESYVNFREEYTLIASVPNIVSRPFYLPQIDVSSLTTIDPATTTMVENTGLGISLEVTPNTAKDDVTGNDFTGQLSISKVPAGLAPAELPDFLDPGLLITIQPVGVVFDTPVAITFANDDMLPPGSEVDIWSLDSTNGGFTIVGVGQVSQDGLTISTISGGIRAADWHAVLPPGASGEQAAEAPTNYQSCSVQQTEQFSSTVTTKTGCLSTGFSLPDYYSQGQARGLDFVYKSNRAYPRPLIPFNLTIPVRAAVPPTVSYSASLGGVDQGGEVFIDTTGLSESIDETLRGAFSLDASNLPTGSYPYSIDLTSNYFSSGISTTIQGRVPVINRSTSALGSGWGISGVSRLFTSSDNRVLIDEGRGGYATFFPFLENASYADFSDLTGLTLYGDAVQYNLGGQDVVRLTQNVGFEKGNIYLDNPLLLSVDGSPSSFSMDLSFQITGSGGVSDSDGAGADGIMLVIQTVVNPTTNYGIPPHVTVEFDTYQNGNTSDATGNHVGININSDFVSLAAKAVSPRFNNSAIWHAWIDYDGERTLLDVYVSQTTQKPAEPTLSYVVDIGGTLQQDTAIASLHAFTGAGYANHYVRSWNITNTAGTGNGAGLYKSSEGDYSSLAKNPDGTYSRTFKNGRVIKFDALGLQTQLIDRNGNTTTYAYDANDRLKTVTDPVGRVTTLFYSGNRLATVTDPAGRVSTFTYDTTGNLEKVVFPDLSSDVFGYDSNHLMISETNELGFESTRVYDASGRVIQATLPDGAIRQASNAQSVGLVDTGSGMGTSLNPAPFVRPAAAISSYTDGETNTRTYVTDHLGANIATTDANNLTTTTVRDSNGLPTKTIRPDLSEVDRTYDAKGNLLTETEGFNGAITTYTYDPTFNLVTSIKDPRQNTTTFVRDPANGNLLQIINEQGHQTDITYFADGLVQTITEPNGLVSTFTYNPESLIATLTETPPVGGGVSRLTTYDYYPTGQLKQLDTPDGITLNLAYDLMGRLDLVTDNLGQRIDYVYDEAGNLKQVDNLNGDTTVAMTVKQSFDALNRLSSITRPHTTGVDSITQQLYDLNGNLNMRIDPKGITATLTYDPGNRPDLVTDRAGGITNYDYDALDNLDKVTAPNGAITDYLYDSLSRLQQEISPDRGTLGYTYDLADNLDTVTDARGIQTTFVNDALNRVTAIQYPDTTENVSYIYDSCPYGKGRVCSRTDESGSYSFTYDAYGNVLSQTYTSGALPPFTTAYTYDAGHNIDTITYPGGRLVNYGRDGVDRIDTIDVTVNASNTRLITNTSYQADNQVISRSYANGITETRQYGLQGRLEQLDIGTLDQVLYSYDINQNVQTRTSASNSHSYNYDAKDRLDDETNNTLLTDYSYDANNNRLTQLEGGQTVNYGYSQQSNRLTTLDATGLGYDLAGNLTDTGQGRTYGYNDAGRMFEVLDGGVVTTTYVYNARGQRKKKITATGTIIYHYDLAGNLIGESNTAGTATRDYIWQNGIPVVQIQADNSDALTYLHVDHLGTPRLGTNAAGTVIWRWEGKAFGNTPPDEDPDGDSQLTGVNLRYPGQYFDAETGLHYNYFRYYDPETGRYITADPIGQKAGPNLFTYVGNNPLYWIDPFGLYECSCRATGPTGRAPDTGQNYDGSGRKWCQYSCTRKDTNETKTVNGPGSGQFCIGQQGGDQFSRGVDFEHFTHDTESFFDPLPLGPFTNGPAFDQAIRDTFGDK